MGGRARGQAGTPCSGLFFCFTEVWKEKGDRRRARREGRDEMGVETLTVWRGGRDQRSG